MKTHGSWPCPWIRGLFGTLAFAVLDGPPLAADSNPRLIGRWPPHPRGAALGVTVCEGMAYCRLKEGALAILDVTDPTRPQPVGGYDVGTEMGRVTVSGRHAYVAAYDEGLLVLDIGDPANPQRVGGYQTTRSCRDVAISGAFACVAAAEAGLLVLDISKPADPRQIGAYAPTDQAAESYSVIAVAGPHAYVVNEARHRLEVIDIGDPANPEWVGACRFGDTGGSDLAIAGSYAYVAAGDLYVIAIGDPTEPRLVGVYDLSDGAEGVVVSEHHAYVVDRRPTGPPGEGLVVLDVADPTHPSRVGTYDTGGATSGVALSGHYAYVTDTDCFDVTTIRHGDGLVVLDISDPTEPQRVGGYDPGGTAYGVATLDHYAYLADGRAGLQMLDVTDLSHPRLVGRCDTPGRAMAVAVSGSYACVADADQMAGPRGAGLVVMEISGPGTPRIVGSVDTSESANDVVVSGRHAYVACGSRLEVFDVGDPAHPWRTGGYDTGGRARGVAVSGGYVYVANGDEGLQVLDVTDPANPQRIGGYRTSREAWSVAVLGPCAYVATSGTAGLQVFDTGDPTNPQHVGECSPGAESLAFAFGVAVSGSHAYVGHGGGLWVIGVADSAVPTLIGEVEGFTAYDVTVDAGTACVAAGGDGLLLFSGVAPRIRLSMPSWMPTGALRFAVSGRPGSAARIQRSTNLREWEDWRTITLQDQPVEVEDPEARTTVWGFYRATGE